MNVRRNIVGIYFTTLALAVYVVVLVRSESCGANNNRFNSGVSFARRVNYLIGACTYNVAYGNKGCTSNLFNTFIGSNEIAICIHKTDKRKVATTGRCKGNGYKRICCCCELNAAIVTLVKLNGINALAFGPTNGNLACNYEVIICILGAFSDCIFICIRNCYK